jgi:hypothetical protein
MSAATLPSGASDAAAVAHHFQLLCEWACALELADVPAPARLKAALVLGDNIAAIMSAAEEPEVKAYHQRLINTDAGGAATLFTTGGPGLSLMNAALGNGLAVTWNELDDGYTRTAVHPGALSQPLSPAPWPVLLTPTPQPLPPPPAPIAALLASCLASLSPQSSAQLFSTSLAQSHAAALHRRNAHGLQSSASSSRKRRGDSRRSRR